MLVALWLIVSIAVGVFASGKGRSGIGWFLLSLVISPLIAGLLLLIAGDKKPAPALIDEGDAEASDTKACPYCAEVIKAQATLCRFCNSSLPPANQTTEA